ncbi:MAG TPA: hypothetical protein VK195_16820 [Burkholderiaceae bacterium]|nr:hypothetical protein [Burkholderiaceae bacterium]
MSQVDQNIADLLNSISRGADGAIDKLHDLVRHEVSAAASVAFVAMVNRLRMQGMELTEYGQQSEDEIHYRAPLVLDGERKVLVLALDIVVTAGIIPKV